MDDRDFPGTGKSLGIIGVPLGFGAGQTGSELGIAAIRLSKIRGKRLTEHLEDLGYSVEDFGDVQIVKPNYIAKPEAYFVTGEQAEYLFSQHLLSAAV